MESKESARLKDIKDELRGIRSQLTEQNRQLKRLADIFDKQWHGDANAASNGDLITVTPYCGPVEAVNKIVARRMCGMDISGVVEEAEKGDTNETEK